MDDSGETGRQKRGSYLHEYASSPEEGDGEGSEDGVSDMSDEDEELERQLTADHFFPEGNHEAPPPLDFDFDSPVEHPGADRMELTIGNGVVVSDKPLQLVEGLHVMAKSDSDSDSSDISSGSDSSSSSDAPKGKARGKAKGKSKGKAKAKSRPRLELEIGGRRSTVSSGSVSFMPAPGGKANANPPRRSKEQVL